MSKFFRGQLPRKNLDVKMFSKSPLLFKKAIPHKVPFLVKIFLNIGYPDITTPRVLVPENASGIPGKTGTIP